ncbi:8321_t:CDS:2 [Acaulospora morrowiae]|uniref:8321_t:CDS:1 n=1 Tax=Acaulospora morrowiae TaxID=94023 RepID=A0A9N9G448_9GLOM|nr:8321_t:CDS:2 [Acaulospora morrowiae]
MVLMTIVTACFNLVKNVLRIFIYFVLPRPAIVDPQANRARDSRLTEKFIQNFEEKYGNVRPDFFRESYSQALERAKNDYRFLMVILEADEHDDTAKFNKETLTSNDLISYLRDNEILVWAGNVRDPEAFQASVTLQATTFPFVAIIVLQAPHGSPGSSPKMTVVDRIEDDLSVHKCWLLHPQGLLSSDFLIARLTMQTHRYGPGLQRFRMDREERESARQIREQQDYAYLASLQADQEKERKAHEIAELKRLEQERARKEAEARQRFLENREKWRRWCLSKLPDEPSRDEKDVTRLSFKLANGERVVRRFRADDTIETIYIFVDTYHLREAATASVVPQPPKDYTHKYDFLLVSPFPRTVYCADESKTIKEERSFWPSANLIVEVMSDENEGDDDE